MKISRRNFLQYSMVSSVSLLSVSHLLGCSKSNDIQQPEIVSESNLIDIGPLMPADENGCRLPEGFTSRVVARSSFAVLPENDFVWHSSPDGGACFSDDEGWIYVSNSEESSSNGGVSAIRFDKDGAIIDAYSILSGTTRNCAGGATPYDTWLSCEEPGDSGRVFECDPWGVELPIERSALGYFNHEAVAYDVESHVLYMTEDRNDGRLYRFIPNFLTSSGFADLQSGTLEVAQVQQLGAIDGVSWHPVPDPLGLDIPTRHQVTSSTPFIRGEGICYSKGVIFFTTTGDDRVWSYDIASHAISILYDGEDAQAHSILTGPDNITSNSFGDLLVAEDGGDLQIVVISSQGQVFPIVQLEGHNLSEITGPAFSPDQSRLYFSSQNGVTGHGGDGITFEIKFPEI